jgi:F-type H+-transporting ATPase subunit alpha
MPVEDQVVQIFAATNGFIDRINVDRVTEFLENLTESVRGNEPELVKSISQGEWTDEIQEKLKQAIGTYAEDFGYDLDEEGLPLDDEARAA